MSLWQGLSTRKPTGGRLILSRKKRRFEIAPEDAETKLAPTSQKLIRSRAGAQKVKLLATDKVSFTDPATGKSAMATIKTVTENPANIHYVRRNILTKGAVVDTDKGKVKITSRPGQAGALSGVLVK